MEDDSVLDRPAPGPDRTVSYGPAAEQVLDVWAGDPGRPLVLFLHGGFWRPGYDRLHTYPLANALRTAGYPVASAEYRRVPGQPHLSTGDVAAALATRLPVRYDGVLLAGHSAGGQLALWAATTAPPPALRGVLALAPVADLVAADELGVGHGAVAAFLGARARNHPELDPAQLPTPACPTVLLHGGRDETLPVSVSRSYAARHPAARLTVLPDADHYALIDPLSAAWPEVLAAIPAG